MHDGRPAARAVHLQRPVERRHTLREPSQAIFDPRSGRALGPSDWDLSPEFLGDLAVMAPPRPAAVLVPIVLRDELTVLLTQRAHDMPSPPGQISFPGGKIEECDATPVDCALREAREEIGLDPDLVEPLGFLDSYRTMSEAAAYVRRERKPAFVHAKVIRPYSHSLSDDERLYKTPEERKSEATRDPLERSGRSHA